MSGATSPGQQAGSAGATGRPRCPPRPRPGRRAAHFLGRHVEHLLQDRQLVPGVAQALRRFGFLEVGEQLADLAQLGRIVGRPCPARPASPCRKGWRAPAWNRPWAARTAGPGRRRAARGRRSRSFQPGVDFDSDTLEFASLFELGDEIAKVLVLHEFARVSGMMGRPGCPPRRFAISGRHAQSMYSNSFTTLITPLVVLASSAAASASALVTRPIR
jgi:hypothetical protein